VNEVYLLINQGISKVSKSIDYWENVIIQKAKKKNDRISAVIDNY
jgi:hypothetical protein